VDELVSEALCSVEGLRKYFPVKGGRTCLPQVKKEELGLSHPPSADLKPPFFLETAGQ
jgi:hypothetical protein